MPRAAGLAAEIKNRFSVTPELVRGSGGIFDVEKDGVMVFSKHQMGRFPENDEVLQLLASDGR
ncbi:MAG: SelT/SelW/SelH family protein [Deltaproteobacteria bacterium]|nr:SelT/SelW/SelH family protein [Deltaproteobacteria bacterium]